MPGAVKVRLLSNVLRVGSAGDECAMDEPAARSLVERGLAALVDEPKPHPEPEPQPRSEQRSGKGKR